MTRVIRNPVVDCAYAKETRVVASCEHRRAGAPLQEGQRSRGTLSSADRMAAQRGQDHRGGVQGHRLQPWLGAPDSPPLQRAGRRGSWRPPPPEPWGESESITRRGRRRGASGGSARAAAGWRDVERAEGGEVNSAEKRFGEGACPAGLRVPQEGEIQPSGSKAPKCLR